MFIAAKNLLPLAIFVFADDCAGDNRAGQLVFRGLGNDVSREELLATGLRQIAEE
jgi:hypothetical protein